MEAFLNSAWPVLVEWYDRASLEMLVAVVAFSLSRKHVAEWTLKAVRHGLRWTRCKILHRHYQWEPVLELPGVYGRFEPQEIHRCTICGAHNRGPVVVAKSSY